MVLDPKTEIDFPYYQKQVPEIFGQPDEEQFAKNYLRICDLTQYANELAHMLDFEGNPWGHKIYCNYALIDPLQRVFSFIVSRGLADRLFTYDGCFNIRRSVTGAIQSVHSWGLAVDFNAATNQYGQEPQMDLEIVKCFAECGFEWGGLWQTPDGMHFQQPWIRDRSGPFAPVPWIA